MSRILDRYASAVRATNLLSEERTIHSATDVLGAVGLAGKRHPFAVALARLFCGDNGASAEVVTILAESAWVKAGATNIRIKRLDCIDIARAVLAWHRDGSCRACGGHGYELIGGSRTLSETQCSTCRGEGKLRFDTYFRRDGDLRIARWLIAEIEREQAKAGPEAMHKLAPRLDFAS